MKKVIYQDQRIAEEFCNFKCDYCEGFCPSGYSLKCDKNGNLSVPSEWYEKINELPLMVKKYFENTRKMSDFYDLSRDIIEKSKEVVNADILKISGGEITTYSNLLAFVKKIHNKYKLIQILTNGLNISRESLEEYKKMGNITFQISLDGIDFESNYARTHSVSVTQRVLHNIDLMLEYGFGVEINCVLTKYNTGRFLDILNRFKGAKNFLIVPRPVRGEPKNILECSKEQLKHFENVIKEHYDEFSEILPSKMYFNRLIDMMKSNKRKYKCYTPYFILSIDGYGNIEQCPCGLIGNDKNNLIENDGNLDNILLDTKYNVFENYKECEYCMTQYELINLYIDGEVSEEELRKIPSLDLEEIIGDVKILKDKINMNVIKKELKTNYFNDIIKIEKNDESSDGNVYMIETEQGKFVAKLYKSLKHTINMVNIHCTLNKNGVNVPKIIVTKDNKHYYKIDDDNYLVVYSFIKGDQIGWSNKYKKLEDQIIKKIANILKKIHNIKFDGINNLKGVKYDDKIGQDEISLLHFDLTRNNIFINDDEISIIDFDDAKKGNPICDISILIANLFFSKTYGVDMDGVNTFVNEYYRDKNENINEKIKLIKKYALKWIDYILDENEFDTSTTESFEVKRKLIIENM